MELFGIFLRSVEPLVRARLLGERFEAFEEPATIARQNAEEIVTRANRLELDVSATDANDLLEAHRGKLENEEDLSVMEKRDTEPRRNEDIASEIPLRSFAPSISIRGKREKLRNFRVP